MGPDTTAPPASSIRPKRGAKGKKQAALETEAPAQVSSPIVASPLIARLEENPDGALEAALSALAAHMGSNPSAVAAAGELGPAAPVRARALLVSALLRAVEGMP